MSCEAGRPARFDLPTGSSGTGPGDHQQLVPGKGTPLPPPPRQPRTRYLLGSEVAELLHVSPKTVARWAKEGKLPCMRTLGGHRRYPEREILELRDKLFTSPEFENIAS